MKKWRNQRGFTLAELLIVVAIIGVLAGVSFVAVQTHQESLNQVELDTVAKEIFVAAQNHLTMAWNENYMGLSKEDYGVLGTVPTPENELDEYYDQTSSTPSVSRDVYHFYVQEGKTSPAIVNLILPSYALDATVRGGNYLIRYQPKTGLVLDVFYAIASPTNKYHKDLPRYETLMGLRGEGKKINRRSAHIGWYGGTAAASLPQGDPLVAPELEVENGDKLIAKIIDKNASGRTDYKIALLVTGKISQAQQVFRLEESNSRKTITATGYEVVLDDITTSGMHFAEIDTVNEDIPFIPGEDIVLRAVAYNEAALSNIANSDEKTVNSLFEKADNASLDERDKAKDKPCVPITAYINSIRHLENLSYEVSNVSYSPVSSTIIAAGGTGPTTLIVKAEQTTDLEWGKADSIFIADAQIYKMGATSGEGAGCFLPINMPDKYIVVSTEVPSSISYDGQHHSIKGITVNGTGATSAGLFGDLPNDSSVKDLALIDFTVTSVSGSAGALAGTLTQSSALASGSANVSNVVAYNTGKAATATITSAGDVGGLIGKVTGGKDEEGNAQSCTALIEKSAAALVVSSTDGNAGGLIGTMEGGTLTGCYSGGHTYNGGYFDASKAAMYNVQAANGTAGGLIGAATGMGDVKNCYSTCSVKGAIAGGFAGTYAAASGSKLEDCYATGLVCGTDKEESEITVGTGSDGKYYKDLPKDGAFAYSLTGLADADVSNCQYYEIINERIEREINVLGRKLYTIYATKPDTSGSKDSYVFLTALGKLGTGSSLVITPLDATAATYNAFVGPPADNTEDPDNPVLGWTKAVPYDSKLLEYYSVKNEDDVLESKFNLRNVVRLGATLKKDGTDTTEYYVATHYGDWPAPEIFVINAAS